MNCSTKSRLTLLAVLLMSVTSGCSNKLPSWPCRNSKRPPAVPTQVELPFSIEIGEPFAIDGLPGRHSFSVGTATTDRQTRFLLVGGSGGGLHGFKTAATADSDTDDESDTDTDTDTDTDSNSNSNSNSDSDDGSKPPLNENTILRVVDVAARKVWSKSLSELQLDGVDVSALQAINAQSCQDGDLLLIAGGYGYSPDSDAPGGMKTFDTLTVIKVSQLINAIISGGEIGDSIQQLHDPLLRVTGGGLQKLGDRYFLVLGQTFDGLYTQQDAGHHFRQSYTRQIRTFRIVTDPKLALTDIDRYPKFPGQSIQPDILPQTDHLRRRDLHVLPAVSPELTSQIAIYGGVFAPGKFDGHVHPIYFDSVVEKYFSLNGYTFPATAISPGIDESYSHLLSQYECASLCLFDTETQNSYTTFFGGISSYWYDRSKNELVKDKLEVDPKSGRLLVDGLPFIQTVSMINRKPDGTTVGYILPDDLPGYLGTNAVLLQQPMFEAVQARQFPNGVLISNAIQERQLVGHIFGGLEAFAPYSASAPKPTQASVNFIPVYVTPQKQKVTPMPPAP